MRMHTITYPQVFQPGKVIFDGKANLFTEKDLGFSSRRVNTYISSQPYLSLTFTFFFLQV